MDKQTKLMVLAVALVALVVAGVVAYRSWQEVETQGESALVNEIVKRPAINFEFTYQSGEEGYRLLEPVLGSTTDTEIEAVFIIVEATAYAEYQNATPGGEAPPSMSIFVFTDNGTTTEVVGTTTVELDRATRMENWAKAHEGFSSYSLAKQKPEVIKIDGLETLHYRADGLYPQDIYIALNRGRYYLIVGQYDGEADPAYTAFQKLVRSIGFM